MKHKRIDSKKPFAALTAATMAIGLFPTSVGAVSGSQVAADGTYSATAKVTNLYPDEDEWGDYELSVSLKVVDGKLAEIKAEPGAGYVASDNDSYFNKAYNKKKGIKTLLEGQDATADTINGWDTVSGATCTSEALKSAALDAIVKAQAAAAAVDTTALVSEIAAAEALTESEYTAESWSDLEKALADAKAVLVNPTSQEAVDAAKDALTAAMTALVKKPAQETYIYGTVNLPYADFYYGELNTVEANAKMDLEAADPVTAKGYREEGQYDSVSSATQNKYKNFAATYYTDNGENGGTIDGIKDVAIAVPQSLYDAAVKAIEDGKTCNNQLLTIVGNMTVTEGTPTEYKVLNGDGTLGAMVTETVTDAEAEASITTSSRYGHYGISVESAQLPTRDSMLGAILETSDGAQYGLTHLENLWFRTGEIAVAVEPGFQVPQGTIVDYQRFVDLPGKTITKITYLVKDGADVVIDTNLLCKKLVGDECGVSTEDALYPASSVTVGVDVTGPSDSNYKLDSVTYGRETLTEGTDYSYVDGKLTIQNTETTGIGQYTVTFVDDTYEDLQGTFVLKADMAEGSVKLENNKLVVNDENVTLAQYIAAIDGVTLNGKVLRGSNLGSTIFNEDGSVNFDAQLTSKGNTTPVFAEGENGTYTLRLTAAGYPTVEGVVGNEKEEEYTYVYAGLTYAEYYAAEPVQAAGSAESSDQADSHGELDKGAFDAVSRATTNHGLHRGNFQSMVTIYDTAGNAYEMSHWDGQNTIVLTDGTSIGFNKGTITKNGAEYTMAYYEVEGIKYVPVKVKSSDYEAFKSAYTVIENGGTLAGGYSENNLQSYAVTAEVTENTNGLKTAVKNEDGSFSFSARQSGTDSGVQGQEQKVVDPSSLTLTVKEDSAYGDFIRVDFTDNYGDLGANMQAVVWNYYGSNSTDGKPLATYGTKFAADNWMHKSMGIQLGLTESLRCTLPEGTDGTGNWTVTVYALGYADYTASFSVTADQLRLGSDDPVTDTSALEAAIAEAQALNESDYTADSWQKMQLELDEAIEILDKAKADPNSTTQAAVEEATTHLNNAIRELVPAAITYVYGTVNLPYADFYYGELNAVEANAKMDLEAADPVTAKGYREEGQYDSVSSATQTKYKNFAATYYTDNGENGGTIDGIKDVAIAVPQSLYDAAVKAIEEGKTCNNQLLTIVGNMTVVEGTPTEYKVLNGDGTLGAMVTETVTDAAAEASITTSSRYGHYGISVESGSLPDKDNMLGAILETSDGAQYGLTHLENLWFRTGEIAVAVEPGFQVPQGTVVDYQRFADLPGKTITKITYLVKDGADVVINTNLLCKKLVGDECGVSTEDALYPASSVTVGVDVTGPSDSNYKLDSVTYGRETLKEGTDYSYADGKLTIQNTETTGIGQYTVTFVDDTYEDLQGTFVLKADMAEGSVKLEDNKLVVNDENVTLAQYIAAIDSVSVDGQALRGGNLGSTIFNEDGSVNFAAELNFHGNTTKVFAEGENGTYTLSLGATGYPSVEGIVGKIEPDDPSSSDTSSDTSSDSTSSDTSSDTSSEPTSSDTSSDTSSEPTSSDTSSDTSSNPTSSDASSDTSNNSNTPSNNSSSSNSTGASAASPTTGDNTGILGMIEVLLASLGAVSVLAVLRRKRKDVK